MLTEPLSVTLKVTSIFESLNIPYVIGGSLASAVHGTMRATMDADIVVDLHLEHVSPLVEILQNGFYVDEPMIREAIATKASFNLIHLETMFKIDVFIANSETLTTAQLAHRQSRIIDENTRHQLYITSPEDTILAKLVWYQKGGKVSTRQLQDIEGIIKVQSKQLDIQYLNEMAKKLAVFDILHTLI